jgi:hypothetical protein
MRRIVIVLAGIVLAFGLAAPVLAADPKHQDGPVLLAFNGDITVPAGDQADFVLVTGGTATVAGDATTVIVLDGHAVLTGATVESLWITGGTATIDAASTVTGDVRTLNSTVTVDPAASVGGEVSSLEADLVAATAILAPMALLFVLGFALVTIVAGLALAALGARQVRAAEYLISHEPGQTLLVGLAGLIIVPVIAILAMMTIVGLPLGLAIMFMVWPAAAYLGYLVAGIWIGEWLLRRGERPVPDRPYTAAVVGLLILQIISVVPFVGAIASLFGFGAVLLLAWRVFRQPAPTGPIVAAGTPQPMGV